MVADLNEPTTKDPGAEPAEEPSEPVMETADDLLVFLEPVDQEGPETTEAEGPETTEPETEVANIQTPATEPAKTTGEKETTEAILAQLPIVTRLQPESYYLQVGAFANPESARSAVFAISPGYPIAVEPVKSGDRQLYRLYVGPLTEDEKGTVLYWFKAKGYRDAFIRQGI
jgi:cell division septation protein DedD